MAKKGPTRGDWIGMTLAGVLLGLTLAVSVTTTFGRLPLGIAPPIHAQLTMWLLMPVWLSAIASSFAFETGRRSCTWLGAANLVALVPAVLTYLL